MVSIIVRDDLLLRSFQPEDAPDLFRVIDASRQHLRPWLNWVDGTTKTEHCLQFIHFTRQQQHDQQGMVLGIFLQSQLIGEIGMNQWDHSLKKAQIGYWLVPEQEGKGILQQCLIRFLDFLFEKVGLNKLEIQFIPTNKRSARVAERLGFKVEGLLRQSYLRHGMLDDLVITGMLRSEWQQIRPTKIPLPG